MIHPVTLPPLAGSRPAAAALLAGLPADLSGDEVAVLCRDLLTGSPSFADELVRQLAVERNAGRVVLVGAEDAFERYVRDAARDHAVAERVATRGGHAAAQ
ncbi:MAG: hypothetical protein QOC93_1447 [Actinomycetota bacterium]|jgi:hypothetical protein|nr:hypothetical protein [Cryptosporangiaceae bacterium]MDQ1676303.1 hypothetical protein [Actinomycetota bacterium]